MAHRSDDRFLVLHGLRLKGFGESGAVAAAVGVSPAVVDEQLAKLAVEELVRHREGPPAGWSLTPAGRIEQERLAAEELADAAARSTVEDGYRRFLALNGELLHACTAWQVRTDGPNDHTDAAYDAAVVERLLAVHRQVLPIVDDPATALPRYGCFRPRFEAAISRLTAGDQDYFTKPIIDSYHTVWFELHEDLLSTLGLERHREPES
ncbi:MAG: MarR family transcriptional regulator [Acidimicrobiales bacterium]